MKSKWHLLVLNSNLSIADLTRFIKNNHHSSFILLTSHSLYNNEQAALNAINGKEIIWFDFASFNSTEALINIDKKAYEKSKTFIKYQSLYVNQFKKWLMYYRNQFLHESILKQYNIEAISAFCSVFEPINLGISHDYWKKAGSEIIYAKSQIKNKIKAIINYSFLGICSYFISALIKALTPIEYFQIESGGVKWNLYSMYRLKLADGFSPIKKRGVPILLQFKSNTKHAIAMHASGIMRSLHPFFNRNNLHIVGDAFRPPCYPPYLFAFAFRGLTYIPSDQLDQQFFRQNGIKVLDSRPPFLETKKIILNENLEASEVKTILLSINHAGDWSALISRADTDLLIKEFAKLSMQFPQLQFVIRMHPTMAGVRAEGKNSMNRILDYAQSLNQENLQVSDLSLEQDWERGDLFISEYSLSVIDAIKKGKLGFFFNPTGRQSFMEDWEKIGLLSLHSFNSVLKQIETILREPSELHKNNMMALKRYDQEFTLDD